MLFLWLNKCHGPGSSDFQSSGINLFWFLVLVKGFWREKQQTFLCFTDQRVHFSLGVVIYFSPRGVSWPSGLRRTVIKPCVTVSAAHLLIITGSWAVNQGAESQSFTAEAISASRWCCFITTCTVVWTEKSLPSGYDWLRVETVWIDVQQGVYIALVKPSHFFSLPAPHWFIPQIQSGLKTWLWCWFIAWPWLHCGWALSTATFSE